MVFEIEIIDIDVCIEKRFVDWEILKNSEYFLVLIKLDNI